MKRLCTCDNCLQPGEFRPGDCRLCWLYHNDPRYQTLWQEEPPSLLQQATNLGQAAIRHLLNGRKKVSKEAYDRRLAICQAPCEKWNRDVNSPRCLHKKCGCFLKTKAWWESETCPLGKWPNGEPGSACEPEPPESG